MPSNKNAQIRYKYLDDMLSDRHHVYDIHDLTEHCNEQLIDSGLPKVTQRCIEKDINTLEYSPFYAEIERVNVAGKRCLRYADPSYSIFHKALSNEEKNLITEMLNTIGQFDGLAHFDWFERLKKGLGVAEQPKIISFSNNPYLQNSNLLGTLFDNISNHVVVNITYHTFSDATQRNVIIHPYLLKQYNDRWFLIGANDKDYLLTFALDRIDNVESMPGMIYKPSADDLMEHFEDIIGVTLYTDRKVEHITLWASDEAKNYILTKPIHGSQKQCKASEESLLRNQYKMLEAGTFFTINCIPNYELVRELSSFGKDLLVLSPQEIQNEVYTRVSQMNEKYLQIRT